MIFHTPFQKIVHTKTDKDQDLDIEKESFIILSGAKTLFMMLLF